MDKLISFIKDNRKLIIITFEIFWIFVFILRSIAGNGIDEIPQFIYVNF